MLAAVNYHYIRKNFNHTYPSIFGVTPRQFETQLEKLSTIGSFVSQLDLKDYFENGKKLNDKSMIITFDDGLAEQYDLALPILKRMGIPAIFFISTKTLIEKKILNVHKVHLVRSVVSPEEMLQFLLKFAEHSKLEIDFSHAKAKGIEHYKYDTPAAAELKYILNFLLSKESQNIFTNQLFELFFEGKEEQIHETLYMNEEQIRDLAGLGFIGSHGYDHDPIGLKSQKEQEFQVKKSSEILKELTQKSIYSFSYPYGSFNSCEGLSDVLQNSGFTFSFTMERAINKSFDQPFYLSRFDNNDMPLGKSYKCVNDNFFDQLPINNWRFDETVSS